jgi:hypothetical protein
MTIIWPESLNSTGFWKPNRFHKINPASHSNFSYIFTEISPMNSLGIGPSALLTDISMCINHYRLGTPGLYTLIHATTVLESKNYVTSVLAMVNKGKHKQSVIDYDNDVVLGAPNFVLDIISEKDGLGSLDRKPVFEKHRVKEYLILRDTEKLTFEWNRLINGKYESIYEDEGGMIKSTALPGLWIPVEALKQRNWWAIMAATDQGMSRKEYHEFMKTVWQ